jgi:hypothetical protein
MTMIVQMEKTGQITKRLREQNPGAMVIQIAKSSNPKAMK